MKTRILQIGLLLTVAIITLSFAPKIQRTYTIKQSQRENSETLVEVQSSQVILESIGILRSDEELLQGLDRVKEQTLPESSYLEVPFYCQAPLETVENWVFHEESCEEAAALQAFSYLTENNYGKEEANKIILNMIEWQKSHFGEHKDLYAEDMEEFISGYFEIRESKVSVMKDATIDEIKKEVSRGYPVIVPITGEILKNPHYPYPGYHMLTVIGYSKDKIITNDNGTMHGANFSYDIDTFETAFKDASGDVIIIKIDKNSQYREPLNH